MSFLNIYDCYKFIPNKFELVLVASKRARDIALKNAKIYVEPLRDKVTIIALREIEQGHQNNFINDK